MPGRRADGARRQGLPGLVADAPREAPRRASPRSAPKRPAAFLLYSLLTLGGCSNPEPPPKVAPTTTALDRIQDVLARVSAVLEKNHKSFEGPRGRVSGFGAGDAYPQIWLRDSSWIVDAASAYFPEEALTSWLDLHLSLAEPNGRLRDWVAKGPARGFREWAPEVKEKGGFSFDTNSNESDQEPSAALALCRAETILDSADAGARASNAAAREHRRQGVIAAMQALLRDRTDPKSGLIWSGLTADWGDVSPVHPDQRAIYRDDQTPRTLSLYTNVMVYAALDCLARLGEPKQPGAAFRARADRLREKIQATFWLSDRGFYRLRRPLDPEPPGFEGDGDRFALGGNALAALFGVADDAQAASIFETAERLRLAGGFRTISTTLVPPYAAGVFQHPVMREPGRYQNGGEWDWFGALLVEAEFERGHSGQARAHLDQMASRIVDAGPGIHEWYAKDGSPQGSPAYAAAAATIHDAVLKGLLGVAPSPEGYRITVRTGGSIPRFEVEQRARSSRLVISQTVSDAAIDLRVESDLKIAVICSVIPRGRRPSSLAARDRPMPQDIHRVGEDTIICADAARAPGPAISARFGLVEAR